MTKKTILFGILGVTAIGVGIYLLNTYNSNHVENSNQAQTELTSITNNDSEEYIPTKPLPEGLPVYPEAILINEIPSNEGSWQWLFQTTGSGREIMTFFINSLSELGFSIDNSATIANHEEFFVITADKTIRVYWLDSESIADIDNVTPDTPNRNYAIFVDLNRWETR